MGVRELFSECARACAYPLFVVLHDRRNGGGACRSHVSSVHPPPLCMTISCFVTRIGEKKEGKGHVN